MASAGEYDILITGDLSKMAEYRVLARHALPDIELLVAGHHGAKTSTSEALLEITQPETVFLSVGEGNRYGHPAPETLARLDAAGTEILRTDRLGAIRFVFDDVEARLLARRGTDASYGARPLRRLISAEVEDALASLLLEGTLTRGDTAVLAAENGTRCVRRREEAAAAALGDVGAQKA